MKTGRGVKALKRWPAAKRSTGQRLRSWIFTASPIIMRRTSIQGLRLGFRAPARSCPAVRAAWLRPKQTDLVPGKGQLRSRFPQSAQLRLSDNDFWANVSHPIPAAMRRFIEAVPPQGFMQRCFVTATLALAGGGGRRS